MKTRFTVLAALAVAILATTASAQPFALVTKKGTKCMTSGFGRPIGNACTGDATQMVQLDFSFARFGGVGLRLGGQCLRRANWDLTLAACNVNDKDEAFFLDTNTLEISNSDGQKGCIDLSGNAGDWRPNQPIALYPCHGGINQKWLPATVKPSPGPGKLRQNNTLGEVQPGDYIHLNNGQFLVVK